jgi:valyl-tRNA synthetase
MVVDETGDKMSKVKANSIDPLDLIHGADFETVVQKALPGAPVAEAFKKFKKAYPSVAQMGEGFPPYGADAVRLTLCSYSPQARRIALSPKRIEGYRNFCNKIYNAVRFALPNIESVVAAGPPAEPKILFNRWILSRLGSAVSASTLGIDEFRLDDGSGALYRFVWDELCDWYLELTKPVFRTGTDGDKDETARTLAHCIETALRALHPYAPFVTEELWQRVRKADGAAVSVALAPYPTRDDGPEDADAERAMGVVMSAITAARTVRAEHGVQRSTALPLVLRAASVEDRELLAHHSRYVAALVNTAGDPGVEPSGGERPRGWVLSGSGGVEVLVDLKGLVDPDKERERIERGLKKADKDISGLDKRLQNPKFVEKAPPEVVDEARAQLDELRAQRERLVEARALLEELEGDDEAS